jgi:predicted amidophosphoribosyltransferase
MWHKEKGVLLLMSRMVGGGYESYKTHNYCKGCEEWQIKGNGNYCPVCRKQTRKSPRTKSKKYRDTVQWQKAI